MLHGGRAPFGYGEGLKGIARVKLRSIDIGSKADHTRTCEGARVDAQGREARHEHLRRLEMLSWLFRWVGIKVATAPRRDFFEIGSSNNSSWRAAKINECLRYEI